MLSGKIGSRGVRLVIRKEIDAALPPEIDILGPVTGDMRKPHPLESGFEQTFFGSAELNKFEAVKAKRILVRHHLVSRVKYITSKRGR
jgi:hypothetical protein